MWTKEEDELLKFFYKKYNGKFDKIAAEIPQRNKNQCQ
jgi:hypothetical protein